MFHFVILLVAASISFSALGDDDFNKIFDQVHEDKLYTRSVGCRGNSMTWHIIAVYRINGDSEEQIIQNRLQEPDQWPLPQFRKYLESFYQIPIEGIFEYLAIQHGKCMENSLGIPMDKASFCFKQYEQPQLFKLFGPNAASKPQDPKDNIYADANYLKCLRSEDKNSK